jgi:hypothetical protein
VPLRAQRVHHVSPRCKRGARHVAAASTLIDPEQTALLNEEIKRAAVSDKTPQRFALQTAPSVTLYAKQRVRDDTNATQSACGHLNILLVSVGDVRRCSRQRVVVLALFFRCGGRESIVARG